jgi:predicted nuclease of restriction endonuclease-like (RecB) superfamily
MDIKGTADCFDSSTASRRREDRLSWSHHKELKRLRKDEQALQEMKQNAAKKNWSVQDLREKIDSKLNAGKTPASARSIPVEMTLYGRLQNLAAQQGVDIKKLVADALSAYLDQQPETAELEELVAQ